MSETNGKSPAKSAGRPKGSRDRWPRKRQGQTAVAETDLRDAIEQTVHIFNRPIIPTADQIQAPRDLPRNYQRTPSPVPFYFLSVAYAPLSWFVCFVLVVISAVEFFFVTPHVSWIIGTIIPLFALAAIVICTFWAAVATAWTPVMVIRRDRYGRTEVDEQAWPRLTEGRHWGNAWRKIEEDKRGRAKRRWVIIDAQEYWQPMIEGEGATQRVVMRPDRSKLRPFLPERARRPVRPEQMDKRFPVHLPSPAELGTLSAIGDSLRMALDIRDRASDVLKMAAFALVVSVALVFLFMGGSQVNDTLKESNAARNITVQQSVIDAAVDKALRSNNIYILPTALPTQIPVPGILEPGK